MTQANLNQMDLVTVILKEIDRQFPKISPLSRQYNAVIDAANLIVHEFSIGEKKPKKGEGLDAWRRSDQVGMSSDFMASKLSGKGVRKYAHPHDPSDFGRCLSLLEAAPELREHLPNMGSESKHWAALVSNWDILEALYYEESPTGKAPKLYEKIQALYADIE